MYICYCPLRDPNWNKNIVLYCIVLLIFTHDLWFSNIVTLRLTTNASLEYVCKHFVDQFSGGICLFFSEMWSTSVFVVFNSWNSSSLQGKILIYELSPFYRTWGDLEEISKYDIILLWKLKKKYEINQMSYY